MIQEASDLGKEIEELRWERDAQNAPSSNAGPMQKGTLTKRIRKLQRRWDILLNKMGSNRYILQGGPHDGKVIILPKGQRIYEIPIRPQVSMKDHFDPYECLIPRYIYERTSCRTMVYTGKTS